MKQAFFAFSLSIGLAASAQPAHKYAVAAIYHIPSPGGWDYISVNNDRIYVSHGTQANVLSTATGDSVGIIANTPGIHGIAFNNSLGRGYTSNGRSNNVTVFDLKTNAVITQVATGENPDAIMYDPFTKTVITCNGRSHNLTVIDAATNTVKSTIDVGGKPETAVANEKGLLYVNVEDKNEIVAVDLKSATVTQHWPLGAEGPTGLAYDKQTARLFAGCDKVLVVLDAATGKVIDRPAIGDGCDGVAFDPKAKIIYTSNGADGTLTAIKEVSADKYTVLGNFPTKKGGRTIGIDEKTGVVYIPTADVDATQTGANGRPRMIPGTFQVMAVK